MTCFLDGAEIRPINNPQKIAWLYFYLEGKPWGTLEERQFQACHCGCMRLIANPPINQEKAPTNFLQEKQE